MIRLQKNTSKNMAGTGFCAALPQKLRVTCPVVLSNVFLALPSFAGGGKIFDFNATLPAMVVQFLLLMVFLDKTWFGPVGKVLDERDIKIQSRLSSVKSGDDELEALSKEAEQLLKVARTEA